MALELFFQRAPAELGLLVAENLHNMLLADVHEELGNIIFELYQAQKEKEELLLCPHCDLLFDLDNCVWADLDDDREGPHFNCNQNGRGHTCPQCEKRSTNKLIKIVGHRDKYMSLGCYSMIFGAARGRTAQTIAWCASCSCESCRGGVLSLELCNRFASNTMYEQFHMREENHPLYNKPRHHYSCRLFIELRGPGLKGIYFSDSDDTSNYTDSVDLSAAALPDSAAADPTDLDSAAASSDLVGKFRHTYRESNEPIGKVIYLSENTVKAALEAIGVDLTTVKLTIPSYKKIGIEEFLSKTINSCWREEVVVRNI